MATLGFYRNMILGAVAAHGLACIILWSAVSTFDIVISVERICYHNRQNVKENFIIGFNMFRHHSTILLLSVYGVYGQAKIF